jgi:TRAP-type mannitol/chloroaromatic compound transport system substrate-binding protein
MESKITRRGILKTGLVMAAAGAATTLPNIAEAGKTIKMRIQTHWSQGVPWYKETFVGFADQLNALSNKEWQVTPLPDKTVVPAKDIFEAVSRGVLDMSMSWPSYWVGKVPVATFFSGAPFTWDNYDEMQAFIYESGALDIIRDAYAEHGVHLVGPVACGPTGFYSKKPLVTPEDFKGFKPRCTGLVANVMKGMGASPVFFPMSEVYQALQTGVVDGAAIGGMYGGWAYKLQEVTEYFIKPYMTSVINADLLVNKKKWDSLPAHCKKAIETACVYSSANMEGWMMSKEVTTRGKFKDRGGKIVQCNEDSVAMMRKLSLDVFDEYAKKDPKYCGKLAGLMHEFLKDKI